MIEKSLTAPRKKKVKGQLHKLAYITDKEAKLLQKFGGQKVMTPEKIPAYPPPGERGGPGSGAEGRAPSGEGRGEYRSPPPAPKPEPRVSPIQSIAMTGDISLAGKTQDEAQASVDRDNKLEQMKMAKRGLMKPVLLPTPKKRTVYKTSDTGPFKKDGRDYQDKIRQTKREIEFDPNLSNEEKVEKNQILDDFVYKGAFVAEPKKDYGDVVKKGIFNLGLKEAGLSMLNPALALFSMFKGKKPSKSPAYDLATDLFSNINLPESSLGVGDNIYRKV